MPFALTWFTLLVHLRRRALHFSKLIYNIIHVRYIHVVNRIG